MSAGTDRRSVRISDEVWAAAQAVAAARGESVSDVIRRALTRYAARPPAKVQDAQGAPQTNRERERLKS